MSKSPSRRFPVTVTQLPVTRCQICHRTVAYRPGSLSEVLTEHYRRAHPEALDLASRSAGPGDPHKPLLGSGRAAEPRMQMAESDGGAAS